MPLEDAKKVSMAIDEKPVAKPPRHIDDILSVLDQSGQFHSSATKQFKSTVAKLPPSGATDMELAVFYEERGDAARQLGYMKQALDDLRLALMYSERIGIEEEDDALLLNRLGAVERFVGNFRTSIDLLKRSLEIKKGMATYYRLIDAYIKIGDIATAEKLSRESIDFNRAEFARQSIKKRKQARASRSAESRDFQENHLMYLVLQARGKYAEAETSIRKTLDMAKAQLLVDRKPRGTVLSRIDLSMNLTRQHRFLEAEIEARQAVKEALGFGGAESDLTAMAVMSLAQVMLAHDRIKDAEQLARASIRILESSGIPSDAEEICSARMFLGNVLSQNEDFVDASNQFDLAAKGMQENPYLYTAMIAKNPILMFALLRTGRLDEGIKMISNVYELDRKIYGEKHTATILILGLRGIANDMAGNSRGAFDDFSSALPILTGQTDNEGDVPSKLKRIILEAYIDFLGRIHGTSLEKELGGHASEDAFQIAGHLGSRTVQSALSESSARSAAAYDHELSDLVRKEQDIHQQVTALQENMSDAMMAPPDQQDPQALKNSKTLIENLSKARSSIFNTINKRFPKYANFISQKVVTFKNVRDNLHENEALLSIFTAGEKTYVWAVPQNEEPLLSILPLGKNELTQMVRHLRLALDPNPATLGDIPEFDLTKAYNLYSRLFKPVESAWKHAKDLLITVSSPLGDLPLELLPTEPVSLKVEKNELFANYRQVPWLIRKVSITMLPSVNALVTLRSLPDGDPKRKAFAGFGDPVFNQEQLAMKGNSPGMAVINKDQSTASDDIQLASRGIKVQVRGVRVTEKGNLDSSKIATVQINSLKRLPDTADEIRSIAKVLKADAISDVFLGTDFSHQRLQTMNLSDRRVIAFATHALVPGDLDGLDQPALAISSPSVTGGKGDGLLTTDQILKLKLNADWVVLSACNTGASEGKGTEAVSGMGKAFFYAGTRALLVSMWSVETTSAHKLVTGIFQAQEENNGLSRAQALQKSILNLIDKDTMKDETSGKIVASYAHPLFWAPFVIVGDPGKTF